MDMYLYDKICDAPFGDLVPLIASNMLDINIVTISKGMNSFAIIAQIIEPKNSVCKENLMVFKSSDHHDGIIFKDESMKCLSIPFDDSLSTYDQLCEVMKNAATEITDIMSCAQVETLQGPFVGAPVVMLESFIDAFHGLVCLPVEQQLHRMLRI